MKNREFTPLVFLSSLGAGGIAVIPFVLMQYTLEHGNGLITRSQLWAMGFSGWTSVYYSFLEAVMILFSITHIILTAVFAADFFKWVKTDSFSKLINDPLKNTAVLPPLISLLMTMNVFIGPVRYFTRIMQQNFQGMMMPALILWSLIFIFTMGLEIHLLGVSFKKGFDIKNINFGWLLHPFLLGMLTVVGTGIAAMSKNTDIASIAAFMTMISGSMGIFLLIVKLVVVFSSHFASSGLPEKQFLPSFLIVVPVVTLFSISGFRLGHFLERIFNFHMDLFSYLVIGFAYAFEIWYLFFGIYLLKEYFKNHHFRDFYVTQWGLICPFVAFSVLGGFAYRLILPSPVIHAAIIISMITAIVFYIELFIKHFACLRKPYGIVNCEG